MSQHGIADDHAGAPAPTASSGVPTQSDCAPEDFIKVPETAVIALPDRDEVVEHPPPHCPRPARCVPGSWKVGPVPKPPPVPPPADAARPAPSSEAELPGPSSNSGATPPSTLAEVPSKINHVYIYKSSGVEWNCVLTLVDEGDRKRVQFHTQGIVSDEHGSWTLRENGSILKVNFNYREDAQQPRKSGISWPLHPTMLYRQADNNWIGEDDKACSITCTHVRSMGLYSRGRWLPVDPI